MLKELIGLRAEQVKSEAHTYPLKIMSANDLRFGLTWRVFI